MSMLVGQRLKASGGQEWRGSCTMTVVSSYVSTLAERSLQRILCRRVTDVLKFADTFFLWCQRWWHRWKNGSALKLRSNLVEQSIPLEARRLMIRRNCCGKIHRIQHGFSMLAQLFWRRNGMEAKTILFLPQLVALRVAYTPVIHIRREMARIKI